MEGSWLSLKIKKQYGEMNELHHGKFLGLENTQPNDPSLSGCKSMSALFHLCKAWPSWGEQVSSSSDSPLRYDDEAMAKPGWLVQSGCADMAKLHVGIRVLESSQAPQITWRPQNYMHVDDKVTWMGPGCMEMVRLSWFQGGKGSK